jgi:predicted nucleic acid-binding protein
LILDTNDLSMPIDAPSGIETARHYTAIRMELKLAGKPIPANDAWIAALSRQHAVPIMSRDCYFDFVGGLRRRTW